MILGEYFHWARATLDYLAPEMFYVENSNLTFGTSKILKLSVINNHNVNRDTSEKRVFIYWLDEKCIFD